MIRQNPASSSITKTFLALDLGDRIGSTGRGAEANFFRRYAKNRFIAHITINVAIVLGRCQPHFRALAAWLREHGVEGDKLIHVLCKEFGSRINEKGDIHAASMALRHADIGITAQFYGDSKRVTTGFGLLFRSAPSNVVAMDESIARKERQA